MDNAAQFFLMRYILLQTLVKDGKRKGERPRGGSGRKEQRRNGFERRIKEIERKR